MMFFRPVKLSARLFAALSLVFCLTFISTEIKAQSKKTAPKQTAKKEVSKKETAKNQTTSKKTDKKIDDKKTAKKETEKNNSSAKTSAKNQTKDQEKSAKNAKNAKPSKAELARIAEEKRREEARQAEIRRAEEARRQAALAEQRRREQAAREARERALAFERGLKTETLDNIAKDNTEGEDLEVRRAAINALAGHAGTVVVMEPQTGKVLSIVNQDWAIRKGFKPCSTVKLVTATAGLNERVIDSGTGAIQTRRFPMNLDDALAHSNNSYFQTVGASVGNTKMISYAKALGLGEPTGINADNEAAGKLPYGNNNAKIYSHGEDFEVTAIQLAVAVSAISNGGKLVVPQTPKTKIENTNFRGYLRREVENVSPQTLQRILPGMLGAVNYGTATRASDGVLNIAGKTGSCIGQGSWLGLFASVAPVVNPRLAVIVITRGSGERGKYASAIAGNIYRSLSHRFNDGRDFTAKVPLEYRPQQKVNAKTSATLDSDEGEDSNEGDVNKAAPKKGNPKKGGDDDAREVITVGAKNSGIKTTDNKNNSKPASIYEPIVIQVNREQTRPRIVPNKNN